MSVYKFIDNDHSEHQTNIKGIDFENDWLRIWPDGLIEVEPHYAWNGCSPKFNLLDFTLGTPDGKLDLNTGKPLTYYASKVHDVLYQFKGLHGVKRKEADDLFLKMLQDSGFMWAKVYYGFVRAFGWMLGKW